MGADRLFHLVRALVAAPATPLRGHPRPHSLVRLTLLSTARMRRVAVSCSASGPADKEGMTYKGAGMDIDAGTELVCRIRKLAPEIGFGGLYPHGALLIFLLVLLVFCSSWQSSVP
ncbi:phosphoribosylformylglycinamidine cyclo-ligase, chloroplastic [Hordeum vulgare]|nr:phosphoribosylformylglycinamidine cyclo-ligase, chloroplastic [Hordeum vulgare]